MPRGPKGWKRPADVIGQCGPCHADRDGGGPGGSREPWLLASVRIFPGALRLTGMVDANLPKQARSLFRSEAAMIKQEHGVYIASCDRCGQTINTGQKSMQQAANYLSRAEGWDSWPRGRVWRNSLAGLC